MSPQTRSLAAGAAAATVWALLEPLDQRLFRYGYSDVALLGKFGHARPALAPARLRAPRRERRARSASPSASSAPASTWQPRRLALAAALAEHVALFPLSWFVDRYHPARGEERLPPLATSLRAFGQATVRHAVFGLVLGRLAAPRGG